jgi:hypothetical protein
MDGDGDGYDDDDDEEGMSRVMIHLDMYVLY